MTLGELQVDYTLRFPNLKQHDNIYNILYSKDNRNPFAKYSGILASYYELKELFGKPFMDIDNGLDFGSTLTSSWLFIFYAEDFFDCNFEYNKDYTHEDFKKFCLAFEIFDHKTTKLCYDFNPSLEEFRRKPYFWPISCLQSSIYNQLFNFLKWLNKKLYNSRVEKFNQNRLSFELIK